MYALADLLALTDKIISPFKRLLEARIAFLEKDAKGVFSPFVLWELLNAALPPVKSG